MPLKTMVLRDEKGSPLTNAEMDANLRSVLEFMNGVILPQTAHNLDDYDTPGVYGQNATAGAAAGSNYPVPAAGVLTVKSGGGAGNIVAQQEYRTYFQSSAVTEWYRNKGTAGWSPWYQRARMDQVLSQVLIGTASDANELTVANTIYVWTNGAVVNNGTNWPALPASVARGSLEVVAFSGTQIYQRLTLPLAQDAHPLIFERYGTAGGSWFAWRIGGPISSTAWLPTASHGDVYVDGDGWYTWGSSAYVRARVAKVLPTTTHDLNTYTIPDVWWQNQSTAATVANNYPADNITCFLEIQNFGAATLQEVSTRTSPYRKWWRIQTGASSWSDWKEYADMASAMTHKFLTSATDANTLTEDNVFYTWVASVAVGANFPQFTTAWPAAGYMRVYRSAPTQVAQELTFLITGQRARTFTRFGNSVNNTWQPWKATNAWHAAVGLPVTDMGDIYVDGDGTYRWNATLSKYIKAPVATMAREGLITERANGSAILVRAGRCASSDGAAMLELTANSTRTLQTSGGYSHGASGNGLLTGARVANTYYHAFLLRRDSDGVVAVAFDTSVTCANRPTGYSHYRRVGSIRTDANGFVWPYTQIGNQFWFDTNVRVYTADTVIPGATYQPGLGTPRGVNHTVHIVSWCNSYGGSAPLISVQRPTRDGSYSESTYMVLANTNSNYVTRVSYPQPEIAGVGPNLHITTNQAATLTLWVEGYTDHFED
ncbi:hypothetical protein [Achromobacter phage ewik_TL4]|nr:hypothetical protein [Achromobacter phage hasilly_LB3]WNO48728.1 hypothetical protein [Achromobacter phage nyaak_TL1]WNO48922.1 hypothetical protein [Achromobacter phage ewii_LB8]WNO49194.1 hypothetical protein [Achromobacter phage ewik_TL4]